MTPTELATVREAESRIRILESYWLEGRHPTTEELESVYGARSEHDYEDDRRTLSLAYLALTDPTPLSAEALVGMGGIKNPKSELGPIRKLCVCADGQPEEWEWTVGSDGIHDVPSWLNPRTVGELRQLLARLEKR